MKKSALAVLVCCGCLAPAQTRPNRREVLRQLCNDIDAAMQHATLKDKDRARLDTARGNLQTIGEVQRLERSDRQDLKRYLNDIRKRTGRFQPSDRAAVETDLRKAHDLGLDKGARITPPRAVRRLPRYPRRWP